jgi:hypothetical protein
LPIQSPDTSSSESLPVPLPLLLLLESLPPLLLLLAGSLSLPLPPPPRPDTFSRRRFLELRAASTVSLLVRYPTGRPQQARDVEAPRVSAHLTYSVACIAFPSHHITGKLSHRECHFALRAPSSRGLRAPRSRWAWASGPHCVRTSASLICCSPVVGPGRCRPTTAPARPPCSPAATRWVYCSWAARKVRGYGAVWRSALVVVVAEVCYLHCLRGRCGAAAERRGRLKSRRAVRLWPLRRLPKPGRRKCAPLGRSPTACRVCAPTRPFMAGLLCVNQWCDQHQLAQSGWAGWWVCGHFAAR